MSQSLDGSKGPDEQNTPHAVCTAYPSVSVARGHGRDGGAGRRVVGDGDAHDVLRELRVAQVARHGDVDERRGAERRSPAVHRHHPQLRARKGTKSESE